MIDIIYIAKLILIVFVLFISYQVYERVVHPYLLKRKYKKYPNVKWREPQHLLLGDLKNMMNDVKEGKPHYHYSKIFAQQERGIDIKIRFMAHTPRFLLQSIEAQKQLVSMIPEKIDRMQMRLAAGKLFPTGLINIQTTEDWKERRKAFTKTLDLNFASKYIPLMTRSIEELMKSWKTGEYYDFLREMNIVTFKIISSILFGSDVGESGSKLRYKTSQGKYTDKRSDEFLFEITQDLFKSFFMLKTQLGKKMVLQDIGEPYKTNKENINTFWEYLRNFLASSKDDNSVYRQLKKNTSFSEDKIFFDLFSFLFGGFETSSHILGSCLYYLKKSPEKLEKLLKELESNGLKRFTNTNELLNKEVIQRMDYLASGVKETLRMDPPVQEALPYFVNQDVEIGGVPIKKGNMIELDQLAMHYNPEQWHEPMKFIPERFDSESDYFTIPGSKDKKRHPLAYIPFSHGPRACPGQTLALLEIKTMIAFMLTSIEYELHPDIQENDNAGFAIGSRLQCDIKITKNIFN